MHITLIYVLLLLGVISSYGPETIALEASCILALFRAKLKLKVHAMIKMIFKGQSKSEAGSWISFVSDVCNKYCLLPYEWCHRLRILVGSDFCSAYKELLIYNLNYKPAFILRKNNLIHLFKLKFSSFKTFWWNYSKV